MRWATIAVVVVVAATFALVVRPPIKDPALAHQLISMQRDIDKVAVQFNGPVSFSDVSDALKHKTKDADAVDATNTDKLGRILDAHGWPTDKEVGNEATFAALDIVQRSSDLAFKVRALGLMDKAGVKRNADYARLVDTVAVSQGLPQTYGTQWVCENATYKYLTPLRDPSHLRQLRSKVGLPGRDEFAGTFCADPGQVRIIKRHVGG